MNFQVTKDHVEAAIKAKINKVDGDCVLTIPADCTPEQFQTAVLNLITRGKRNFSQALDNHADFTFANLISTKVRASGEAKTKLPEKVKEALNEAKARIMVDKLSGAFGKMFKAKAKGRDENTFAIDLLVYLVNQKLADSKSKKGIFKDVYANEIKVACADIANQKPESSDIMEADF